MLRKGMLGLRNPVFIYLLEHPFSFGEKIQRIIQASCWRTKDRTVDDRKVIGHADHRVGHLASGARRSHPPDPLSQKVGSSLQLRLYEPDDPGSLVWS